MPQANRDSLDSATQVRDPGTETTKAKPTGPAVTSARTPDRRRFLRTPARPPALSR